ncbi:hypothetical protein SS05631_b50360 (plasmid) [Sinorhizobium sp. CCBAU 05631]|nr:hypothetical protein SS05631_b50360 [Sinorhizobium sp. CCBAU 05631]
MLGGRLMAPIEQLRHRSLTALFAVVVFGLRESAGREG